MPNGDDDNVNSNGNSASHAAEKHAMALYFVCLPKVQDDLIAKAEKKLGRTMDVEERKGFLRLAAQKVEKSELFQEMLNDDAKDVDSNFSGAQKPGLH
ncbi:MAG: hypothetical protein DHS20C10_03620 [marine bacterium B5-7]|nr:MAG: hypothetical protein DHS20C10_03620 [marine bacterium B5-7]